MKIGPVSLAGAHVQLVPLTQAHCADLQQAAGDLHELWYTWVPHPDAVATEVDTRNAKAAAGKMVPFAVLDPDGRAVGMTTYMDIDHDTPRLEIGSTWYAKSVQRTPLNTEAKRLLLGHAFETIGCVAVEFRTHALNHQSRRAVERLGAKLDGILRNHIYTGDGTLRDTAVYSILNSEWPTIRTHLDYLLSKPR
ncbi:GNAT family protein [Yoonia sp. SS1-5]|uniref:GNAT family protein n=1 Tax=Yoonia rhodophyticola TaxID=3137370 RepID=A0AAN0MAQ9_9RHOB